MISSYDYYRNRPEIKPIVDCLDILTELCGIVPVDYAIRVMNEQFDPEARTEQVYEIVRENLNGFEPDFGIWSHSGIDYFIRGSLTAASCNVAEFYRSKHQIYTYDEETGEYVGEYGPPNYERAEAERLSYVEHLASAHDGIEPPADLSEYLEQGVEDALFDRPVTKEIHRAARANRRNKMANFDAEQAIRKNIRCIIGCDGSSDVWVPLLVDTIVAFTAWPLRDKLDIRRSRNVSRTPALARGSGGISTRTVRRF